MRFTVLGGRGFIGRHLVAHLSAEGHEVAAPEREECAGLQGDLGHVIYAIGLTGDFRQRPRETIEAHATLLARLLESTRFQSWLYLSSTRVYGGLGPEGVGSEATPVPIMPSADSLYDASKLLGESCCLGRDDPRIRVARLSNVYGAGQGSTSFLGSVLEEIRARGFVTIREDRASSKDYVAVGDVAALLPRLSLEGRERLYNVASGAGTTHGEVAEAITRLTGARIAFAPGGLLRRAPCIDIGRVRRELGFAPRPFLTGLTELLRGQAPASSEGDIP